MTTTAFAILMPWGRVGSNLVVSVLSDHCAISIANEPTTVLRSRQRAEPVSDFVVDRNQIDYLRDFPDVARFGLPTRRGRLIGMKLSHRSLVSPMAAYAALRERGFRIIAMDRDNHIKTAISQIRAEQRAASGEVRQPWSVASSAKAPGPSVILANLALQRARVFAQNAQAMREYLAHFFPDNRLDIRYEDLNADPQAVIRTIAGFVGLDLPAQFDLPHQKATADDLSHSVTNWDEVRAAFAASEFAPLLDA